MQLRFSGSARIVRDAALRESMSARGKTPDFVLAVDLEEAFFDAIIKPDEAERLY